MSRIEALKKALFESNSLGMSGTQRAKRMLSILENQGYRLVSMEEEPQNCICGHTWEEHVSYCAELVPSRSQRYSTECDCINYEPA